MEIKSKMFSYLKFWLKSSNQHGLHSPFVYNYLTKGLYEVKNQSDKKQLNWILKSINYFNPNKIFVCDALKNQLVQFHQKQTEFFEDADLIFVNSNSGFDLDELISKMNSEQLLFICNEKYQSALQRKLQNDDSVIVLVDFYVGSLISKRTEQLKQNFFLRL